MDRREIEDDMGKVRRRRVIYLVAGLGMFVLGSVLLVLFIIQRNAPALLLGIVAFIWGAILANQALRCRDIEDNINTRLECLEKGEDAPVDAGVGEPEADVGEGSKAEGDDEPGPVAENRGGGNPQAGSGDEP